MSDDLALLVIQNQEEKKYFAEEGTVEFSDNNLLILTSTVKDLKDIDKNSINDLIDQAEKKLKDNSLSDKDKYVMSYKIDTLKEINQ